MPTPSLILKPGATASEEADTRLLGDLVTYTSDNIATMECAKRLAVLAIDLGMNDLGYKFPITVGKAKGIFGLRLYTQIALDHDLYGFGAIRVFNPKEIVVLFQKKWGPQEIAFTSEEETADYLRSDVFAYEGSEDVAEIRDEASKLYELYNPSDDSDTTVNETAAYEKISEAMNRLLARFHTDTDDAAYFVMKWLQDNKAEVVDAELKTPAVKFDDSEICAEDLKTYFTVDYPLGRTYIEIHPLRIALPDSRLNGQMMVKFAVYGAKREKASSLIWRVVRELTLSNFTVVTTRNQQKTHRSSADPKTQIVNAPLLDYAFSIKVEKASDTPIDDEKQAAEESPNRIILATTADFNRLIHSARATAIDAPMKSPAKAPPATTPIFSSGLSFPQVPSQASKPSDVSRLIRL